MLEDILKEEVAEVKRMVNKFETGRLKYNVMK